MEKFQKLGKILSKKEQKKVIGGNHSGCEPSVVCCRSGRGSGGAACIPGWCNDGCGNMTYCTCNGGGAQP